MRQATLWHKQGVWLRVDCIQRFGFQPEQGTCEMVYRLMTLAAAGAFGKPMQNNVKQILHIDDVCTSEGFCSFNSHWCEPTVKEVASGKPNSHNRYRRWHAKLVILQLLAWDILEFLPVAGLHHIVVTTAHWELHPLTPPILGVRRA